MGLKVRVPSAASAGLIMVPNLGSFVPNKWTDVSDENVARYESIRGRPIDEEAGLEVKRSTTRKKESE